MNRLLGLFAMIATTIAAASVPMVARKRQWTPRTPRAAALRPSR